MSTPRPLIDWDPLTKWPKEERIILEQAYQAFTEQGFRNPYAYWFRHRKSTPGRGKAATKDLFKLWRDNQDTLRFAHILEPSWTAELSRAYLVGSIKELALYHERGLFRNKWKSVPSQERERKIFDVVNDIHNKLTAQLAGSKLRTSWLVRTLLPQALESGASAHEEAVDQDVPMSDVESHVSRPMDEPPIPVIAPTDFPVKRKREVLGSPEDSSTRLATNPFMKKFKKPKKPRKHEQELAQMQEIDAAGGDRGSSMAEEERDRMMQMLKAADPDGTQATIDEAIREIEQAIAPALSGRPHGFNQRPHLSGGIWSWDES